LKYKTILLLLLIAFNPVCLKGSTWQVFNQASGLCGNIVHCYGSFKSTMAVGTDQGVSLYDGNNGSWTTLRLPDEVASTPIKDLAFDSMGHLWLATNRGLITVQGKNIFIHDSTHMLPTVDIDRIQITQNQIYVGCFGGYVARAYLPQTGFATFSPVNYLTGPDAGGMKIKSVGVSGLAMNESNQGWIGTRGGGLNEISGTSEYPVMASDGNPELWINDFYIFEGEAKAQHIISATPSHLGLIKNFQTIHQSNVNIEEPWFNCVVTVREPEEIFELLEIPDLTEDEKTLADFLGQRSLYAGTRNNGLWRFQKGKWTQYLTTNSNLPSDCINRLYNVNRLLIACTDAGLLLIHLDSDYYDEFKKIGLGNLYAKTIYPFPPLLAAMVPHFQVIKGSSYWFSHLHGVSRWRSGNVPKKFDEAALPELASRIEKTSHESELDGEIFDTEPELPTEDFEEDAMRGYWQLFTKTMLFYDAPDIPIDLFQIPSMKITRMTVDKTSEYLWVIFDRKHLYRMRMVPRIVNRDGQMIKIENPDWQNLGKYVPWPDGTELNTIWYDNEKIYVGTNGNGFYIINNPNSENLEKEPFDHVNFNQYNGLSDTDVRGFANWKPADKSILVLLHKTGATTWDGEYFESLGITGRRRYTCIAAGAEGNLWLGSATGGVFRVSPDRQVYNYTAGNAFFESNHISAIATKPMTSGSSFGVWVACDELADDIDLNPLLNGSDQAPGVITDANGKKRVLEQEITGSSLHYFNGLTWEKWLVAGVCDIMVDRDFIWLSTNLRIRRLLVPR